MNWGQLVAYVEKAKKAKTYSDDDEVIVTMYTVRKRTRAHITSWGFGHDGRKRALQLGVVVEKHPKVNSYNTVDWRRD